MQRFTWSGDSRAQSCGTKLSLKKQEVNFPSWALSNRTKNCQITVLPVDVLFYHLSFVSLYRVTYLCMTYLLSIYSLSIIYLLIHFDLSYSINLSSFTYYLSSVYLSALSVHPSTYVSIHLSIIYLSICLSVCLSHVQCPNLVPSLHIRAWPACSKLSGPVVSPSLVLKSQHQSRPQIIAWKNEWFHKNTNSVLLPLFCG